MGKGPLRSHQEVLLRGPPGGNHPSLTTTPTNRCNFSQPYQLKNARSDSYLTSLCLSVLICIYT